MPEQEVLLGANACELSAGKHLRLGVADTQQSTRRQQSLQRVECSLASGRSQVDQNVATQDQVVSARLVGKQPRVHEVAGAKADQSAHAGVQLPAAAHGPEVSVAQGRRGLAEGETRV